MKTLEEKVTVKLKNGLHARPSSVICNQLKDLDLEDITIQKEGESEINARQILALILLAADHGTILTVRARGKDAQAAIDEIKQILETDKWEELPHE